MSMTITALSCCW